ncbi:MAG: LpxI family protein [Desulfovibrionales bacterium]|nr:LpxI family protein [Desulfovibrionales bacterium]
MATVLGIIAGGGSLPTTVADNARSLGSRIVGVGFAPDTDPSFPNHCDEFIWLKLGQLGRLVDFFTQHGVTHVVMAGPINKPRALDLRPDWRAARLLLSLRTRGDDALLRAVGAELEKEGMLLVGPHHFSPDMHTPAGLLTRRPPDKREQQDIDLGWSVAEQLGSLDIGQCLVIREGIVLAVEAIEGTDATIRRGGTLGGPGAVVVKRPKAGQDRRLDLPAVGLETVQTMAEVGAGVLAIEAGQTLFFERQKAVDFADRHGIAIIGRHVGPLI